MHSGQERFGAHTKAKQCLICQIPGKMKLSVSQLLTLAATAGYKPTSYKPYKQMMLTAQTTHLSPGLSEDTFLYVHTFNNHLISSYILCPCLSSSHLDLQ